MEIEILHLYLSEGHNFFGRHDLGALNYRMAEQNELRCVAGRGVEGDRFFDYKKDYKGQITFFANEVYESLCAHLQIHDKPPSALRRNVVTAGVNLNDLIGKEFEVQGIRFLGTGECSPCYWMNESFGQGAEAFLKGQGGLRAKILSDGILSHSSIVMKG